MTLLKITLFCVFGIMQCGFKKTHYFPHAVHYCCSSAFVKCAAHTLIFGLNCSGTVL